MKPTTSSSFSTTTVTASPRQAFVYSSVAFFFVVVEGGGGDLIGVGLCTALYRLCIRTHTHTHQHIYIYMYIYINVRIYIYMHICVERERSREILGFACWIWDGPLTSITNLLTTPFPPPAPPGFSRFQLLGRGVFQPFRRQRHILSTDRSNTVAQTFSHMIRLGHIPVAIGR